MVDTYKIKRGTGRPLSVYLSFPFSSSLDRKPLGSRLGLHVPCNNKNSKAGLCYPVTQMPSLWALLNPTLKRVKI